MAQRWNVLFLLFGVRLSMAFQFQSVASMSPTLMTEYGVGLADVGLLIGLYLTPGLVFAIPGGEIGRRLGDKNVVLFGLSLMIGGGLVMAFAPTWGWQIAGRLIAGMGGVLLNVLMSKIVTDWFAGKEIATAMAIFVNSWPAGIALSLLIVPLVVAQHGLTVASILSTAFCALGFCALALLYRAPRSAENSTAAPSSWPRPLVVGAMVIAGSIWGLFNAALGMVFGFGTTMLVERGWTLIAAGSTTSIVLWIVTISVPAGGLLADRTGKRVGVMLIGFALFAIALFVAARTDDVIPAFVALGVFSGISAGPIMSLPSRVLSLQTRAVGMGIYFTLFYAIVFTAPIAAGLLAGRSGSPTTAFDLGSLMLAMCFPAYWLFSRLATQAARQDALKPKLA